jgi:DNA-binding response OmpR family regulator
MTKVLLVEDDVALREIYSARFTAENFEVASAGDGEEALAKALKEKPDIIILDIMMPKISGMDVLDILRSTPETKDTKIIIMSALSQSSDIEKGKELGADAYLVKSQTTLSDVVEKANEVLARPPRGEKPTE